MTAPIAHGYPDWGRFSPQSDVNWLTLSGTSIAVTTNYGAFFLGTTSWLGVDAFVQTNNARISLQFFRDAGLSQIAGVFTFDLLSGGIFDGAIPVNGPYLYVTVIPSANPAVFDLGLWSAAGPISGLSDSDSLVLISEDFVAFPVGTSIKGPASRLQAGPSHFFAEANVASWAVQLEGCRYDGTFLPFAKLSNVTGAGTVTAYLPTMLVRARCVNGTGGAGNVTVYLVTPPLQTGV
jgi:hypothetical protein